MPLYNPAVAGTSAASRGLQVYPEAGKAFFPQRILVSSTMTPTDNLMYAVAFEMGRACTLSALEVQVATAGGASAVARLGVYADDGTVYPGARVLDGGTVACATTGRKTLTVSQALTAGSLYWFVVATQANGGAVPAFLCGISPNTASDLFGAIVSSGGDYFNGNSGTQAIAFTQASVSGVLPANFTTTRTLATSIPAICAVA